jgi:hypothetical protein
MTRRCVVRGILRIKPVRKLMTRVGLSVANIDFGPSHMLVGTRPNRWIVFRDPPNFVNSCSFAKVHPNLDRRKHVNSAQRSCINNFELQLSRLSRMWKNRDADQQ